MISKNKITQNATNITDKKKWVINMSSRQLTHIEIDLLAKGLNFSITSKTLPNKDIIATIEDAVKDLEKEEADMIRSKVSLKLVNSKPPKDNLFKDERKALKELQSDTSIVILPADKDRSTVILNREDYLEKCMDCINNGPYQLLKKDPTTKIKVKTLKQLKVLKDNESIDNKLYYYLKPTDSPAPRFYGQQKIHKPAVPIRPIVSYSGSPLIALQWEAQHLQPQQKFICRLMKVLQFLGHYNDDDVCSIVKRTQLENFFHHINNLHQNIKFTMEEESNGELAFLETLLKQNNGEISVLVYRKPTHTDQYLHYSSHHQTSCKECVVSSLFNRVYSIITNKDDLHEENARIKQVLKENGYQGSIISKIFKRITNNHSLPQLQQQTQAADIQEEEIKMSINLPYVEGTSEKLRRILKSHKIRSTLYTENTLRKLLCKPKDRVATEDENNIVYEIDCSNCEAVYFVKSKLSLKSRSDEHKRSVRNCDCDKNEIAKHCWEADHNFNWDQKKVIDRESTLIPRKIKETIHSLKNPNHINKISYMLPEIWLPNLR